MTKKSQLAAAFAVIATGLLAGTALFGQPAKVSALSSVRKTFAHAATVPSDSQLHLGKEWSCHPISALSSHRPFVKADPVNFTLNIDHLFPSRKTIYELNSKELGTDKDAIYFSKILINGKTNEFVLGGGMSIYPATMRIQDSELIIEVDEPAEYDEVPSMKKDLPHESIAMPGYPALGYFACKLRP